MFSPRHLIVHVNLFTHSNGVLSDATYGDTPNKPSTWDAFRLFGCLCDPQYTGYDCSLYTCPFGDDPDTAGQVDEQQMLSCSDSDGLGNIVLKFREQVTASLSPMATTLDVQTALEALPAVGKVRVEILNNGYNNTLCQNHGQPGNTFVVTFLTTHGALPAIQPTTQYVDSFAVTETVQGTKEVRVCCDLCFDIVVRE